MLLEQEVDLIVTEMGSYLASLQKDLQHLENNIRTIYSKRKSDNVNDLRGILIIKFHFVTPIFIRESAHSHAR